MAGQARRPAIPLEQLDLCERHVARIVAQGAERRLARLLDGFRSGDPRRQCPQAVELAVRQHTGSGFVGRAEDAVGAIVVTAQCRE